MGGLQVRGVGEERREGRPTGWGGRGEEREGERPTSWEG